ncbi:LuxR family two component transcriptional regulator [Chondrocystis sp. NIES-4102]|nr:LuxR family two component transcriptional regulator [Chondrocystis sp. NIES-4102]
MVLANKLELETIRVIIADDQEIVRQALKFQLATETQIKVIACVDNGMTALEKIAELSPDIIIIDLEMPTMDGITAIKQRPCSLSSN